MFYFSTYRPNLSNHLPPSINKFLDAFCKKIMLAAVQTTDKQLIAPPYANFCPPSKLITSNMCFWSCKTLFAILDASQ